ncbi:MAG: type II toxin-antitoxin system HicA family toxin [Gammaproteobacteria bacterium]
MRHSFYRKRQHGSHLILRRDVPFAQLVVPDHKELDRGTLRAIIRQANLTIDEFTSIAQYGIIDASYAPSLTP